MKNLSKYEKFLVNLLIALAIMILTSVLVRCEDKHYDKINYRNACFIYEEELECYKDLVQALDDYQFEVYHDTVLMAEDIRAEIDYFEEQLDSIYSANKPF